MRLGVEGEEGKRPDVRTPGGESSGGSLDARRYVRAEDEHRGQREDGEHTGALKSVCCLGSSVSWCELRPEGLKQPESDGRLNQSKISKRCHFNRPQLLFTFACGVTFAHPGFAVCETSRPGAPRQPSFVQSRKKLSCAPPALT